VVKGGKKFGSDAKVLNTPETLFDRSNPTTGTSLNREMLQAQIEVASRPHTTSQNARAELIELRQMAAAAAADHGLAILASGTHPSADWRQSVLSRKDRYHELIEGLQMVGQRNMLCGMHVHVEVPDPDTLIDVMNRMIPYVPLLLTLSTSSPFWNSRCTGLKGYRLTAYDELPRTGLPELFCSMHEYEAYVCLPLSVRAPFPMRRTFGGRSGHPASTQPWSCERQTAARASVTLSP
jgi:carboxylate-amine ligase